MVKHRCTSAYKLWSTITSHAHATVALGLMYCMRVRLKTSALSSGTMLRIENEAWRGVGAVLSGAFVHLTLGTLYTIGNLNVYFLSSLCEADESCEFPSKGHPSPTYNQIQGSLAWIFAAAGVGQASLMFLGGRLENTIGPRYV